MTCVVTTESAAKDYLKDLGERGFEIVTTIATFPATTQVSLLERDLVRNITNRLDQSIIMLPDTNNMSVSREYKPFFGGRVQPGRRRGRRHVRPVIESS